MHSVSSRTNWYLALLFITLTIGNAPAQNCPVQLQLNNVPPTTGNSRFTSDMFAVKHPALSINGFNCTGSDCDKGWGLKQILEKVYTNGNVASILKVYENILDQAANTNLFHSNPTSLGQIRENTQVLQSRAFVALVTYILEQNGSHTASNC